MDELRTATGKTFQSDYLAVLPEPARAYIRIVGVSLPEIAAVFEDPAETIKMQHGDVILENYTRLIALANEPGAIKIILGRN